jgi:hypothetical protein
MLDLEPRQSLPELIDQGCRRNTRRFRPLAVLVAPT